MQVKTRNTIITVFVIVWTLLFHYESVRHFYIQPFFKKPIWKVKFLFPPAGWIMFYNVDAGYAHVSIIGVNNQGVREIDPHYIFATRTIGFDNIHRGITGNVLYAHMQDPACTFLQRKFPEYRSFIITLVAYPSVVEKPLRSIRQVAYQCGEEGIYESKN